MWNHYGYWIVWIRLPFMYVSVLVSFCWCVFPYFIYFYCFLMISICFSTDFMTFILKNPRNSMTSVKRSNVQTKPNKHIMTDDFRISELVTLAPGFRCGSGTKDRLQPEAPRRFNFSQAFFLILFRNYIHRNTFPDDLWFTVKLNCLQIAFQIDKKKLVKFSKCKILTVKFVSWLKQKQNLWIQQITTFPVTSSTLEFNDVS